MINNKTITELSSHLEALTGNAKRGYLLSALDSLQEIYNLLMIKDGAPNTLTILGNPDIINDMLANVAIMYPHTNRSAIANAIMATLYAALYSIRALLTDMRDVEIAEALSVYLKWETTDIKDIIEKKLLESGVAQ